jgi:hypothetical protein
MNSVNKKFSSLGSLKYATVFNFEPFFGTTNLQISGCAQASTANRMDFVLLGDFVEQRAGGE